MLNVKTSVTPVSIDINSRDFSYIYLGVTMSYVTLCYLSTELLA